MRLGVALYGDGIRVAYGFAVLQELKQNGICAQAVAGAGDGALAAVLYAAGLKSDEFGGDISEISPSEI